MVTDMDCSTRQMASVLMMIMLNQPQVESV